MCLLFIIKRSVRILPMLKTVHVCRTIFIVILRPPITSITTGRKGGKVLFVDGYVIGADEFTFRRQICTSIITFHKIFYLYPCLYLINFKILTRTISSFSIPIYPYFSSHFQFSLQTTSAVHLLPLMGLITIWLISRQNHTGSIHSQKTWTMKYRKNLVENFFAINLDRWYFFRWTKSRSRKCLACVPLHKVNAKFLMNARWKISRFWLI